MWDSGRARHFPCSLSIDSISTWFFLWWHCTTKTKQIGSDCTGPQNSDPQLLKQPTWEAKPQLCSTCLELTELGLRLSAFCVCLCLFIFVFTLPSNSGQTSESQFCSPNQSCQTPCFSPAHSRPHDIPMPTSANYSTTEAFHFCPHAFPLPALPLSLCPLWAMAAARGSSE